MDSEFDRARYTKLRKLIGALTVTLGAIVLLIVEHSLEFEYTRGLGGKSIFGLVVGFTILTVGLIIVTARNQTGTFTMYLRSNVRFAILMTCAALGGVIYDDLRPSSIRLAEYWIAGVWAILALFSAIHYYGCRLVEVLEDVFLRN